MSSTYSVEIDCRPGTPRPNTHFSSMCVNCEVDPSWFNLPSKCFGNWEWTVKPEYVKSYQEKQDRVGTHLNALYESGSIRYASW